MAGHIYITGDTHSNIDIDKLNSYNFPAGKTLDKNDYVIICGDFGFIWANTLTEAEEWWLNWFEEKPWTTLFIDGNHENHVRLNAYPVDEWNGGKVHKISNSVIHLMRGQVFNICGKSIFTMGGAVSIDKEWRTEGLSWWPQEVPSAAEFDEGFANLEKVNNKVDIIITHAMPSGLMDIYYSYYKHDDVTNYLNIINTDVEFKDWYFGHYHDDKNFGKYHMLYNTIVNIV